MSQTTTSADAFDAALDAVRSLLAAEGMSIGAESTIRRREPGAPAPLSFSQELVWLLDRATPGMTAYNMPIARRIRGPLDRVALERALDTIAARHEILRTRLVEDAGEPRQFVDSPAATHVRFEDVSSLPVAERERAARDIVRERARAPFDLAAEHAFRATLVRLADDDHILVLELHHIAVDGWSLGILFRELAAAYAAARAGSAATLPDVPLQYGDYATWQRQQVAGERLTELLDFWRAQLGDATEPLGLPTDYPRNTVPSFAGARESVFVDGALVGAVKEVARRADATLYMILLAAYGLVLHRYAGRDDVLIGSGSAGRTQPEIEALVGYVNTTLVQRVDVSGNPTVEELLARVRASALGAYDHQDIPLEKLVLELRRGDARASHAPLFDVVLTMQDTMQGTFTLDGLVAEPFGADLGATKFDITLLASERDGGLWLTAQYRSELFAPETMRAFLGHIVTTLRSMAQDPHQRVAALRMLTSDEQAQLSGWRDTRVDEGRAATLTQLFELQAARVGAREAVREGGADGGSGRTLTYSEIDTRANQLARHLQSLGAGPGALVGLLIDRAADAIVAMLGILKAGAAYVPLAPEAPAARIARQLKESGVGIVVAMEASRALLPADTRAVMVDADASAIAAHSTASVSSAVGPDDLAYVLYTSGSTGAPKGVAVTHGNVVHYARAISRVLADVPGGAGGDGFAAIDGWRFTLVSSLTTDLGNTSVFPALLAGGTLDILPSSVATSPAAFASYIASSGPDVVKMTPSHARALIGDAPIAGGAALPARWLVLGGEALSWDLASRLRSADRCRLLNHYGPTETTVGVATYEVREADRADARTVPIGRALSNTRCYVVDANGNEQPIGIPGELLLAGDGVARGYLNDARLTAERFVQEPGARDAGARAYRTGDRVRRLRDGALEFLGRLDDQVKVHGFRVEPADVESAIRRHAEVSECVVIARPTDGGDTELCAFVVPAAARYGKSGRIAPDEVREWARRELPGHMVPAVVAVLDELPRTASGKIDRRALAAHDVALAAEDTYVEPTTATQTGVAAIWADVLKRDRVGATDDFIVLGGHSLLAIRILGRITRQFGVRLPLRTLFDAPTVEQLAAVIDRERATSSAAAPGIVASARDAFRIGTVPAQSAPTTSGERP